jgi:hypothetical protein
MPTTKVNTSPTSVLTRWRTPPAYVESGGRRLATIEARMGPFGPDVRRDDRSEVGICATLDQAIASFLAPLVVCVVASLDGVARPGRAILGGYDDGAFPAPRAGVRARVGGSV